MIAIVLSALLTVLAASPAPGEVSESVRQVYRSEYQRDLPGAELSGDSASGGGSVDLEQARRAWLRRQAERAPASRRARSDRSEQVQFRRGGVLSSIAQLLLWGVAIIGLTLLALWVAREFAGYTGDPEADQELPPASEQEAERRVVKRPLGDADALAATGDFGDAIHTLLLRTLQELVRQGQVRLPPSLTSREILARVALSDDARQALTGLVMAVEVSHFGCAEPCAADYQRCREQFDRFAVAYTRGRA